ncbi:MAG: IS1634 family transposase [Terrimicrobiaceae bacterium]
MERLEIKKIKGHSYYYYSKWGWVNGKCRRQWQKYLGKLEDIAKACSGGGIAPLYAELFQWGLPTALWKESLGANIADEIDRLCPKRDQGLSTGEYIAIAAVNRAIQPDSKRSMWEWFSRTALIRHLPGATKEGLCSQRFWDHMDRMESGQALLAWKQILAGVIEREKVDLSSVSYDGTNFYTFIDTFNTRCHIARRGRNKQGQDNLRQVSYALFCSSDGQIPLYYDVYDGNQSDVKQFPLMLERFGAFLSELQGKACPVDSITLVFDKGNNSSDNIALLDSLNLNFVGSVKLGEHKELSMIHNEDPRFIACDPARLEGTRSFRVRKEVYGKERTLVITYSRNLFEVQWQTLQSDMAKALEGLSDLRQKLRDRAAGLILKGVPPSLASVEKQCRDLLARQHLKQVIKATAQAVAGSAPQLDYAVDPEALSVLASTLLGKNILISTRDSWTDGKIIEAYRSQSVIENVFKEMKDRTTGSWWPLHHWTDSKIHVHGLYCTLALLLRCLIGRRAKAGGVPLSMKRLITELADIRQVINVYPKKRKQTAPCTQAVMSKTSELQNRLIDILGLKEWENTQLG